MFWLEFELRQYTLRPVNFQDSEVERKFVPVAMEWETGDGLELGLIVQQTSRMDSRKTSVVS